MKYLIVSILLFWELIFPEELATFGGSFSFANIPTSAFSLSLGNTVTSGLGLPSSLQQNPANLWHSGKLNVDFTHFKDPFDAEFTSVFGSFGSNRYFQKYRFGLGVIIHQITGIEFYDEQANFLADSKNKNIGIYSGISRRISNYYIGTGITYLSSNFTNIPESGNSNYNPFEMYYVFSNIGIGINEIPLESSKQITLALNIVSKIPISASQGYFTEISTAVDGSTVGIKFSKKPDLVLVSQYEFQYKLDFHLDFSFHKHDDYTRKFIRTGLGLGVYYQDYIFQLNGGIKDITIFEDFKFDIVEKYNIKYTYGIFIGMKKIGFSFSGYNSFIPMPTFNSYNGTLSIGL